MDIRQYIEKGIPIPIGISGENNVDSYKFGYGDWASLYGDGVLSINHQRPGDENPYPCTITTENFIATWEITATDTQYSGQGRIQVVYMVNGTVKKTMIGYTLIESSLGENVAATDPIASYIDTMVDLKNDTYQYKLEAKASADTASQKAQDVLGLTAEASINNSVGIPSVGVSVTQDGDHKKMSFAFENLKGEPGRDYGEIVITPEMFGAKGDGIADDTEAFEQMLGENKTAYLKNSYLINGITFENAELNCDGCEIKGSDNTFKGCIISGTYLKAADVWLLDDNAVSVKTYDVTLNRGIFVEGDRNRIQGVTFKANSSSNSACIHVDGEDNTVENCVFPNGFLYGVRISGQNTCIRNNLFENQTDTLVNYSGVKVTEYDDHVPKNVFIENNTFGLSNGDNIDLFTGGKNIYIRNNVFQNDGHMVIESKSYDYERSEGYNTAENVTEGLYIEGNTIDGYVSIVSYVANPSSYTVYIKDVHIRDNTFTISATGYAQSIICGTKEIEISGNIFHIHSTSGTCFRVSELAETVDFQGNKVFADNGGRGLSNDHNGNVKVIKLRDNYFDFNFLITDDNQEITIISSGNIYKTRTTLFTGKNPCFENDEFECTTGIFTASANCDFAVLKDCLFRGTASTAVRASSYTISHLIMSGISNRSLSVSGTVTTQDGTVTVLSNL